MSFLHYGDAKIYLAHVPSEMIAQRKPKITGPNYQFLQDHDVLEHNDHSTRQDACVIRRLAGADTSFQSWIERRAPAKALSNLATGN